MFCFFWLWTPAVEWMQFFISKQQTMSLYLESSDFYLFFCFSDTKIHHRDLYLWQVKQTQLNLVIVLTNISIPFWGRCRLLNCEAFLHVPHSAVQTTIPAFCSVCQPRCILLSREFAFVIIIIIFSHCVNLFYSC